MIKHLSLFLLVLSVFPPLARAESCLNRSFKWSDTRPAVNLRHIFCGEIKRGRIKGFHATDMLATSPVVDTVSDKRSVKKGIFNARVKFINGKSKFSTFFPVHCDVKSITRSIVYAANHFSEKHPQWGILGISAPAAQNNGFCLRTDGKPFTIRMGLVHNRRKVNTAFPQP